MFLMSDPITNYLCEHCKIWSPKEDWGPGRITCSLCKKIAPTAEQFHLSRNEIWNGKEWISISSISLDRRILCFQQDKDGHEEYDCHNHHRILNDE